MLVKLNKAFSRNLIHPIFVGSRLVLEPPRGYTGNGEVDSGGGAEAIAASEAYEKIALALNQGIAPERHLLHLLIKKSQDSVDLNRALDAMYNIRIENAVRRQQMMDYSIETSKAFVQACIRCGEPERALVTLRGTKYGLVPNLGAAHLILSYALEKTELKLAKRVISLLSNYPHLKTSPKTAEYALEISLKSKDMGRAVKIAKELVAGGFISPTKLTEPILEYCVSTGRWKDGLILAGTLSPPFTRVVAVSKAKCLLLQGNVDKLEEFLKVPEVAPFLDEVRSSLLLEDWVSSIQLTKDGTIRGVSMEVVRERIEQLKAMMQ